VLHRCCRSALGELLRRLGYRGHITVGGPFATLARTWLLGRYAWLDSVVRFAGEAPLLALVRALARGESIACVPGLSTRAGDGPPADVLNRFHHAAACPARGHGACFAAKVAHVLPRGAGRPVQLLRPAALQDAEVAKVCAQVIRGSSLLSSGVGGIRRRTVDDVADELAGLARSAMATRTSSTSTLCPTGEADALAWLSDLQRRLKAQRFPSLLWDACCVLNG